MATEIPFSALPIDQTDVHYLHGPDSAVHEGVPSGTVTEVAWNDSTVYPGTSRTFWVYVPAQYDAAEPASLLVFQDGWAFLDPQDEVRGSTVLDNLIHSGDLPVTIAVFVDPGALDDIAPPEGRRFRQRNVEYDAFDDRYLTFLIEEILPEVTQRWSITDDHEAWVHRRIQQRRELRVHRGVAAARHLPPRHLLVVQLYADARRRPLSSSHAQTAPKPLRVFMHVGHRDLGWNESQHNWLAENLRVAAALAEADYDFRLVLGDGGHDPNHGGVLLPDASGGCSARSTRSSRTREPG